MDTNATKHSTALSIVYVYIYKYVYTRRKQIYKKQEEFKYVPVAMVAVADVVADTDDGWDSDVDDVDDMELDIFELDESFLALVLFP